MVPLTTARDFCAHGQLGHGDPGTYSRIPKQLRVMSGLDVKQLAAGTTRAC